MWRWGERDSQWRVFGFTKMSYGDRSAACALEVAKSITISAGADLDVDTAKQLKLGSYVDNACGDREKGDVDKLMGQVTFKDGKSRYNGLVAQILALGGFEVKVMVRNGEQDPAVVELLGGGVLGVPWEPGTDQLVFKLMINLNEKGGKQQICGAYPTTETLYQLRC